MVRFDVCDMTDEPMDDKEFEEFVNSNRDRIIELMGAQEENTFSLKDAVLRIMSDEDVQKHFFTACIEMMHFFESAVDVMPMSDRTREAIKTVEKARDNAIRNAVMVSAKDHIENMTFDDVKDDIRMVTDTVKKSVMKRFTKDEDKD